MQEKQYEWTEQWDRFKDDSQFLFTEWIYPTRLEDFRNKRVLDAGCGHGHHLLMVAPYAREAIGADLNTAGIASQETDRRSNIQVVEGDIARLTFEEPFDIVYCIGVIHHTDNPALTFQNLKHLTRPGGRLIVWAYAHEGNFLNRTVIEGIKRAGLLKAPRWLLLFLSHFLTLLLYPLVYSIYLLPLRPVLPYYDYFGNFRKLNYKKNVQNAYDKLIAPQTFFLKKGDVEAWFKPEEFRDIHISHYKGVSWRCSGTKLPA